MSGCANRAGKKRWPRKRLCFLRTRLFPLDPELCRLPRYSRSSIGSPLSYRSNYSPMRLPPPSRPAALPLC
jgi:hypothetical protein